MHIISYQLCGDHMKRLITRSPIIASMIVLAMSISIAGCEALTEAASINVPIDIELYPESISPALPTLDMDCTDLAEIKDYQDNKDLISGGELTGITFQILELTAPDFPPSSSSFTTVTFTLNFDPDYGDSKTYELGTFSDVNIGDLMTSPMTIPVTDDARAALEKILEGQEKFCCTASYGPLNSGAGSADYLMGELILSIDFTASAL